MSRLKHTEFVGKFSDRTLSQPTNGSKIFVVLEEASIFLPKVSTTLVCLEPRRLENVHDVQVLTT